MNDDKPFFSPREKANISFFLYEICGLVLIPLGVAFYILALPFYVFSLASRFLFRTFEHLCKWSIKLEMKANGNV